MEKMDKGLTVTKWVLINWPKIPQMPKNLCAQIVCPSPKVWDLDEKRLQWASVVRVWMHVQSGEALLRHNNVHKTETQNR